MRCSEAPFVAWLYAALILSYLYIRLFGVDYPHSASVPPTCLNLPLPDSDSETPRQQQQQHFLLLTAHPDDEVMFFAPFLQNYLHAAAVADNNNNHNTPLLSFLCLSTGNPSSSIDRVAELTASLKRLGVLKFGSVSVVRSLDELEALPDSQVQFVAVNDSSNLGLDGLDEQWDVAVASKYIEGMISKVAATASTTTTTATPRISIYTFDEYGISGHPNHQAVHNAAKSVVVGDKSPNDDDFDDAFIELRVLQSTNRVWKYVGPLSYILKQLWFWRSKHICFFRNPLRIARAFWAHGSQRVWYRYLYMLFSRFVFMNRFRVV